MQQTSEALSRGVGLAVLGVLLFFTAGFILGLGQHSNDPELTAGFCFAFAGGGLLCVVAGGIAIGMRLARS